ncbi:unnamed protein product [Linum trigynum]|uniref:Uncharacterized protein n=1 Tax=Linum trigynum TaxID=586398 RepID=A0AAV2GSS7_9ROSI
MKSGEKKMKFGFQLEKMKSNLGSIGEDEIWVSNPRKMLWPSPIHIPHSPIDPDSLSRSFRSPCNCLPMARPGDDGRNLSETRRQEIKEGLLLSP